jgi:hypothetical protein
MEVVDTFDGAGDRQLAGILAAPHASYVTNSEFVRTP